MFGNYPRRKFHIKRNRVIIVGLFFCKSETVLAVEYAKITLAGKILYKVSNNKASNVTTNT